MVLPLIECLSNAAGPLFFVSTLLVVTLSSVYRFKAFFCERGWYLPLACVLTMVVVQDVGLCGV